MVNHYSIATQNDIWVLQVNSLRSEHDNKEILKSLKSKINGDFPDFVVDLSSVEFLNSVGLNFLIKLKKISKASGSHLIIAKASKQIIRLLEVTKLQNLFFLTDTVEDAIQSISANDG